MRKVVSINEPSMDDYNKFDRKNSFATNLPPIDTIIDDSSKNKASNIETFNPIETSSKILKSCNVVKNRNEKVKVLKCGEGHLTSFPNRSLKEVYSSIFNKSDF